MSKEQPVLFGKFPCRFVIPEEYKGTKRLPEESVRKQIVAIEKKIQAKLPNLYREELLKHGGFPMASVEPLSFQNSSEVITGGNTEIFSLGVFYGVHPKLTYQLKFALEKDLIPSGLIPFVLNPGGNYVCFSIRPESEGQIFWVDHEIPSQEESDKFYAEKISNSMEEWVDNFFVKNPPDDLIIKPGRKVIR